MWPLLKVEGEKKVEFGLDPTTGLSGVKMDTGFEPKGGGKKTFNPDLEGIMLTSASARSEVEVREVFFSLAGHYELTVVQIGLKAGGDVFLGTIVARQVIWKRDVKPSWAPGLTSAERAGHQTGPVRCRCKMAKGAGQYARTCWLIVWGRWKIGTAQIRSEGARLRGPSALSLSS